MTAEPLPVPGGAEDGERGNVVAGVALGLGRVAGPEPDGLDVQEGVVVAGRGAGSALGRGGPGPGEQNGEKKGEKAFSWGLDLSLRIIKAGNRE